MSNIELTIRKQYLLNMIAELLSDGPPAADDAQLVADLAFGVRSIESRLAG